MGILVFSFVSLLTFGLCFALWLLFDAIGKQSGRQSSRKIASKEIDRSSNGVSRQLRGRLLMLLGGDKTTANRLVTGVRRANPGKSQVWCYEKVIYDLERDRGGI